MPDSVVGVILAGGLSNRMGGGDKTLLTLHHKPVLQHIIDRLQPQVDQLILNANGDTVRFNNFNVTIIPDTVDNYAGPLAGILAGLEWTARQHPDTSWVMSVTGDTPFLPASLVKRCREAVQNNSQLALVRSQGFCHPTIGLWPVSLAPALRHALVEEHIHKVALFTARYSPSIVDFNHTPVDPFFNINTPEDLKQAETLFAQLAQPTG